MVIQKTKMAKCKKTTKITKASNRCKTGMYKLAQPDLNQLGNYKEFVRYLLANDANCELDDIDCEPAE